MRKFFKQIDPAYFCIFAVFIFILYIVYRIWDIHAVYRDSFLIHNDVELVDIFFVYTQCQEWRVFHY